MANFNFGINCEDSGKANELHNFIEKLNIYQDGLDFSDDRVSVTSTQALLIEIKTFAAKSKGTLVVEVWSDEVEYDEAESKGELEIHEIQGKSEPKQAKHVVSKYKTYSASKTGLDNFKSWLKDSKTDGLEIISEWAPQIEDGSFGLEYVSNDPKFEKFANQFWLTKGIVTSKVKK